MRRRPRSLGQIHAETGALPSIQPPGLLTPWRSVSAVTARSPRHSSTAMVARPRVCLPLGRLPILMTCGPGLPHPLPTILEPALTVGKRQNIIPAHRQGLDWLSTEFD